MTDADKACRFCGAPLTVEFADLGETPLSNAFVTEADVAAGRDKAFPLKVRVCGSCLLVQADEVVRHADIFDADYTYFSSYSDSWVAHARRYAEEMRSRFDLGPRSQVLEVASNDGYLLQHFVAMGINVLGVEPTEGTALMAIARGVPTRMIYFGREAGRALANEGYSADLTAANNVLAHVPDIRDFAAGFTEVLKPEGVATFEFPHVLKLIEECQFDTIYHEHYSYLSLYTVCMVFESVGLRVFDVEKLQTHGGSLRVFACGDASTHQETSAVANILTEEREAGLHELSGYTDFKTRITASCDSFRAFLACARRNGKSVAAYGAAAKGNTFFNVCGVTRSHIDMIADRSHVKQGKLLPGSHIPVVSPEVLIAAKPDYVVIVPWNLADEIRAQLSELEKSGTQFVTAIPDTKIIDAYLQ